MKRWNSSGVSSFVRNSTRDVFSHFDQDWEENSVGNNPKSGYPVLYRTMATRKAFIRGKENVSLIWRHANNTHIMDSFAVEKMLIHLIASSCSSGRKPNEIRSRVRKAVSMIGFARMFRYLIFNIFNFL